MIRREVFEITQKLVCPECGKTAAPIADGVLWLCSFCKSMGYYEQPQGVFFPKAEYRQGNGKILNRKKTL